MKFLATASILLALFVSATRPNQLHHLGSRAQVKLKAVGAPRVAPDGKRMVYTVSDAVMTADKSEFVTQIWMANIESNRIFNSLLARSLQSNPRWSPDGNWIAFLSNRKDNRNAIYLLSANGGEAEPYNRS